MFIGKGWARIALVFLSLAALALTAFLVFGSITPNGGRGFLERQHSANHGQCLNVPEGQARTRVVREPVVLPGSNRSRCLRWTSHYAARHGGMVHLGVETNLAFELMVDERSVSRRDAGEISDVRADVSLAPGMHKVELIVRTPATVNSYLRLQVNDVNGLRAWGWSPVDADDWWIRGEGDARERGARHWSRVLLVLFLPVLAFGALWAAWRGRLWPSGWPTAEWLDSGLITILSSFYFIPTALRADLSFDEMAYVKGGEHYVSNLIAGDFQTRAWRWNMEHPPNAKWIYGFAELLGGFEGARVMAAVLGAATVGLTASAARRFGSRQLGWGAALLLATMPHYVGLVRTCTLEAVILFFWSALMVLVIDWFEGAAGMRSVPRRSNRVDDVRTLMIGFISVIGTCARATFIWGAALAAAVSAMVGTLRGKRGLWVPWPMVSGAWMGLALTVAGWPWLWSDPRGQFAQSVQHFNAYTPGEWFRGSLHVPPDRTFFFDTFLGTTPEPHLLWAAGGLGVLTARKGPWRWAAVLLGLALLLPFAQSISHVRQDLSRYVINACCATAVLGAIGIDDAARRIALRTRLRSGGVFAVLLGVPVVIGLIGLFRAEPYPRTYFASWTGGSEYVAQTRRYALADWCEGLGDAAEYVNQHAGVGESVLFQTTCDDLRPTMREDLIHIGPNWGARPGDWIIGHNLAYELEDRVPIADCRVAHETVSSGVVIGRVLDCRRNETAAR